MSKACLMSSHNWKPMLTKGKILTCENCLFQLRFDSVLTTESVSGLVDNKTKIILVFSRKQPKSFNPVLVQYVAQIRMGL